VSEILKKVGAVIAEWLGTWTIENEVPGSNPTCVYLTFFLLKLKKADRLFFNLGTGRDEENDTKIVEFGQCFGLLKQKHESGFSFQ
jgi:hypothetical protein